MFDKRISKSHRNGIKSARRQFNQSGERESEKFLNAVKHSHFGDEFEGDFEDEFEGEFQMATVE